MVNLVNNFTLKIKDSVPLQLRYLAASIHRRRINHVTFVGITGNTGKTTTREKIIRFKCEKV